MPAAHGVQLEAEMDPGMEVVPAGHMMFPVVRPTRMDMYELYCVGITLTYRATTFSVLVTCVVPSLFPVRFPKNVQSARLEL